MNDRSKRLEVGRPRDPETAARAFINTMEEMAKLALSPAAAKVLTAEDREKIEYGQRHLRWAFDELSKWFFDPRRDLKPADQEHGYRVLHQLMCAVFLIGERTTVTESAKNVFRPAIESEARVTQASLARQRRASSPKEKALRAAIEAERGAGPVAHPTKEAVRIHDGVNRRLGLHDQRLGEVSVDVIRRRLEKFPRS